MDAAELVRQGKLGEAIEKVQEQVRSDPASAKHRVFLFQLMAVVGRWDRAMTQLNVAADMDPKTLLMAQVCRQALQCEALRAEVYAGKRLPLVFGEPAEWVGWMVQANQFSAEGKQQEAEALRNKALEAAPAVGGFIDTHPFEWVADADPRMGPIHEAIIEGRYFWIPFQNVKQVRIEKPADLRDLVWSPVNFIWNNGGTSVGLIPTRYPGTEAAEDSALRMARKTEWVSRDGMEIPLGQRLLATDQGEYPILEVRAITLGAGAAPAPPEKESGNG